MENRKRRRAMLMAKKKEILNPLYVYEAGDPNWKNVLEAGFYSSSPTVTFNSDGVSIKRKGGSSSQEAVILKVDFTPYSKLYIRAQSVINDPGYIGYGSAGAFVASDSPGVRTKLFEFNVSGISGENYVRIKPSSSGVIVSEIRLEI